MNSFLVVVVLGVVFVINCLFLAMVAFDKPHSGLRICSGILQNSDSFCLSINKACAC